MHGRLSEGATATDLVLTVTEMLRKKGVVGKFVEFYGTGLSSLSVPDRATIANMAPEYGATMGFFPVDEETLAYLHFTARSHEQIALGRSVLQGADAVPHGQDARSARSATRWNWIWAPWKPTVAGPKRPQDRVPLQQCEVVRSRKSWKDVLRSTLR